jgi:hypothetical protein
MQQLQALGNEKAARTPAQQKIDSNLLLEMKMRRGEAIQNAVPALQTGITLDAEGKTLVDITAEVTQEVLDEIVALGGEVVSSFAQYHAIRARMPLDQIETLATLPQVRSIRPEEKAIIQKHQVNTSEGDVAHQANVARAALGVDGTGIRICVLSDSVDHLAEVQTTGDLPAVTVLSGQDGTNTCFPNPTCTGEGTAMLEIVYDLAPGAMLGFATANGGPAQFAQNILNLRNVLGCHVIVDDVVFPTAPVFQDGLIAQAVNTVVASGALYFSSAGNSGSLDHGTSGVWEGDFVSAGPVQGLGDTHNFGGANVNRITSPTSRITLQWSDPWDSSANDYDLYLFDPSLTTIVVRSNNFQNGTQNPFEGFAVDFDPVGYGLVIVKYAGADRFLHLNTHRGRLAIGTAGQTGGHSAAVGALSVAAVDVATAGGGAFVGGAANPVEDFSSDGPRRIFFNADGTPLTPGNFSSTGGTVRQKPDIAAANRVATVTPGFNPFIGTSAAAPHAAAIGGLVLSVQPTLTPAQVRQVLTSTVWDIEGAGVDRNSGFGIVNASAALNAAGDAVGAQKADLAGLNGDAIFYTLDLAHWVNIPGSLASVVTGDLDANGTADLVGINSAGAIFYTLDRASWVNIPGSLASVVTGDLDANGTADLVGINSAGAIFYTLDRAHWVNIPGSLASVVTGDLDANGTADLVGINSAGAIFYTLDLASWVQIPGALVSVITGDLDANGTADLVGINQGGAIFYTLDKASWVNIPGSLASVVTGDLDANGTADIVGINQGGAIFYTLDKASWVNIPGSLASVVTGDLDANGTADLVGINSAGAIFYTLDLANWVNIPGTLTALVVGDLDGNGGNGGGGNGLAAPMLISPTNGAFCWITLVFEWSAVPDATIYQVSLIDAQAQLGVALVDASSSCDDRTCSIGTSQFVSTDFPDGLTQWTVAACDATHCGPPSAVGVFTLARRFC